MESKFVIGATTNLIRLAKIVQNGVVPGTNPDEPVLLSWREMEFLGANNEKFTANAKELQLRNEIEFMASMKASAEKIELERQDAFASAIRRAMTIGAAQIKIDKIVNQASESFTDITSDLIKVTNVVNATLLSLASNAVTLSQGIKTARVEPVGFFVQEGTATAEVRSNKVSVTEGAATAEVRSNKVSVTNGVQFSELTENSLMIGGEMLTPQTITSSNVFSDPTKWNWESIDNGPLDSKILNLRYGPIVIDTWDITPS